MTNRFMVTKWGGDITNEQVLIFYVLFLDFFGLEVFLRTKEYWRSHRNKWGGRVGRCIQPPSTPRFPPPCTQTYKHTHTLTNKHLSCSSPRCRDRKYALDKYQLAILLFPKPKGRAYLTRFFSALAPVNTLWTPHCSRVNANGRAASLSSRFLVKQSIRSWTVNYCGSLGTTAL